MCPHTNYFNDAIICLTIFRTGLLVNLIDQAMLYINAS